MHLIVLVTASFLVATCFGGIIKVIQEKALQVRAAARDSFIGAHHHQQLAPWLRLPLDNYSSNFRAEEGIVITTGNKYAALVYHLILCLRNMYREERPIVVYHMGQSDLHFAYEAELGKLPNVQVLNVMDQLNNELLELKGWDVKPFTMLVAPFKRVLLLDADAVVFRRLDSFFHHPSFVKSGALFFHDRQMNLVGGLFHNWLHQLFPNPSEHMKNTNVYRGVSAHHQESGAVVIDKERNFGGLLMTCILNSLPYRKEMHKHTHGDKETFWLGFELTQTPFSFSQGAVGHVGSALHRYGGIAGKLAHFDSKRNLWWMNDGILADKQVLNSRIMPLEDFITDQDGVFVSNEDLRVTVLVGRMYPLSEQMKRLDARINSWWFKVPSIFKQSLKPWYSKFLASFY